VVCLVRKKESGGENLNKEWPFVLGLFPPSLSPLGCFHPPSFQAVPLLSAFHCFKDEKRDGVVKGALLKWKKRWVERSQ